MTDKVVILPGDAPVPCVHFAAAADLAQWHLGQLKDQLARGETDLALQCYPPLGPYSQAAGALAVLRMAMDLLYDTPAVSSLTIRCAGEDCLKAFRFQWNMWFAARKPEHEDHEA